MPEEQGVEITVEVAWRDQLGRYAVALGTGGEEAAAEASIRGASMARSFAPSRTGALAGSITPLSGKGGKGGWTAGTKAALPQEHGARGHIIPVGARGVLANKEQGFFSTVDVFHPGNPATNYMQDAYDTVTAELMDIIRRHMP